MFTLCLCYKMFICFGCDEESVFLCVILMCFSVYMVRYMRETSQTHRGKFVPNPNVLSHSADFCSSTPERASINCIKPTDTQNQAIFVDKYLDLQSPEQEVRLFLPSLAIKISSSVLTRYIA